MADTYELDEVKNLIESNNGITEDQLNIWKEENFGTGIYNNIGNIEIGENFEIICRDIYRSQDVIVITKPKGIAIVDTTNVLNHLSVLNNSSETISIKGISITDADSTSGVPGEASFIYTTVNSGETVAIGMSAKVSANSTIYYW